MKKTYVYAFVIFLSGAVVGALATGLLIRHRVTTLLAHPEEGRVWIAQRLARELRLTAAQRPFAEAAVQHAQAELKVLRLAQTPRIETILDQAEQELGRVLTADQRDRLKAIRERARARWLGQP